MKNSELLDSLEATRLIIEQLMTEIKVSNMLSDSCPIKRPVEDIIEEWRTRQEEDV